MFAMFALASRGEGGASPCTPAFECKHIFRAE